MIRGNKAKRTKRILSVVAVATLGISGAVLAQNAAPNGNFAISLNPTFPQSPPTDFSVARLQGIADFQACINRQYGEAASTALQAGLTSYEASKSKANGLLDSTIATAAALNPATVCPNFGDIDDSVSCGELQSGKSFDVSKLQDVLKDNDRSVNGLTCRRGKLEGARGRLKCMNEVAQTIKEAIQALQKTFLERIQQMQSEVQEIDELIATRREQREEINELLGGGDGGLIGILQRREELQGIVATLPREVQEFKDQIEALQQQRQTLTAQVNQETRVRAVQCFNTLSRSNFKCTRNGPVVTAREYVACRFEQKLNFRNGVRQHGVTTESRARQRREQLENLLDRILAVQNNFDDQNDEFTSIADVQRKWGDELVSFGDETAHFILSGMGRCLNRSRRAIARDRQRLGGTNPQASGLGQAQRGVQSAGRAVAQRAQELFNKYANSFADVTRSLTGTSFALDTSTCRRASLDEQVGCMEDISNNLEGLLFGNTPQSVVKMQIQATDARASFEVECAGVNGCATRLQQTLRDLERDEKRADQAKRRYVLQARQATESFVQQMATQLGPMNETLATALRQINQGLAGENVGGVDIDSVAGEILQFDQNTGLPIPPRNLVDLVGSKMTPQLLDVSSGSFSNSQSQIGAEIRDIEKELDDAQDAKRKIASQAETCLDTELTRVGRDVESRRRRWDQLNCKYAENACGSSGEVSKVTAQVEDVVEEFEGINANFSGTAVLSTGVNGLCLDGEQEFDYNGEKMTQVKLHAKLQEVRTQLRNQRDEDGKLQRLASLRDGAKNAYDAARTRVQTLNQTVINTLGLIAQAKTEEAKKPLQDQVELARKELDELTKTGGELDEKRKTYEQANTAYTDLLKKNSGIKFAGGEASFVEGKRSVASLQAEERSIRSQLGEQSQRVPNGASCSSLAKNFKRDLDKAEKIAEKAREVQDAI